MERRSLRRFALLAPSDKRQRSFIVAQLGVVPWEKSITLSPAHTSPIAVQLLRPQLRVISRSTTPVPYGESLKVIAFDKSTVNRNLSSGYAPSYIPR